MPAPQAARLLGPRLNAEAAACAAQTWVPVLAVGACFRSIPDRIGDGVFVNHHPVLAFVAHDGRRRGDNAPVLVAHSTEAHAALHLAEPAAGAGEMVAALADLVGSEPTQTYTHRWTFARPSATAPSRFHLGDAMVGLCGDGFSGGSAPKVENAWRSGDLLAAELVERLG
jgi:renalase